MSITLMSLVWTSTMQDAGEVAVLACLASHANDYGESCFAGIPRIAGLVRKTERTVTRILQALERGGWVEVKRGSGKGKLTQYTIDVERLKRCQDAKLLPRARGVFPAGKGCHSVTLSEDAGSPAQRVTPVQQRVTSATAKGDIGDLHSLGNVKANVKANTPPPTPPSASEGGDAPERTLAPEPGDEPQAALAREARPALNPEPEPDAEPEFDTEQRAHLARHAGDAKKAAQWAAYYREANREAAKAALAARAEAALRERRRAELGTVEAARAWVMAECGFVGSRGGRGIAPVLEAVLGLELARGSPPWEAAPRMAAAWKRYRARGDGRSGPVNFFRLGHWMPVGERNGAGAGRQG